MIFAEKSVPVNPAGECRLSRSQVWRELERKARDAVPYVETISSCAVLAAHSDTEFDREVYIGPDRYVERVVLGPENRVVFTRLEGPVLGVISNDLLVVDDALVLRFSFSLVVRPGAHVLLDEERLAALMTADYLKAVETTLATVRRRIA